MADTKLSALTEATTLGDTDELYVNDSGTSKRITVANARKPLAGGGVFKHNAWTNRHDLTSNSSRATPVAVGPFGETQATSFAVLRGSYLLTLSWVNECTPPNLKLAVGTAGTTGDEAYFVIYNIDSNNGMPTTKHASWGPFNVSSTGVKTLTSLSTAVTAGFYWVGIFCPTANTTDTVQFSNGEAGSYRAGHGGSDGSRHGCIRTGDTTHSTPSDLSSFTMSSSPSASTFSAGGSGSGKVTTGIVYSYGQTS